MKRSAQHLDGCIKLDFHVGIPKVVHKPSFLTFPKFHLFCSVGRNGRTIFQNMFYMFESSSSSE